MSARWEEANRGDSGYIGKVTLVPNRCYLFSAGTHNYIVFDLSYVFI